MVSGGRLSQQGFEFSEELFDGIEIWAVRLTLRSASSQACGVDKDARRGFVQKPNQIGVLVVGRPDFPRQQNPVTVQLRPALTRRYDRLVQQRQSLARRWRW